MIARYDPLLRLLRLALGSRPLRGRLLLAVAAGAAATGCGVALLAVSGFLLARASQHPSIIAISAVVVAVRALSIGRGVSRYLERLTSHDVAFRVLAQVRVAIWRRLEALAPAGLALFRSGDLLARLVSDVDATQDLFIRGLTPLLAAVLVGGGAVTVCLLILAPAAAVLAAGLLIAGLAVPLAGTAVARKAVRAGAPARGRLAATVTDLLAGAADLQAFGATDAALVRAHAADAELTRLAQRTAAASGLGTGLMSLLSGLTLWAVLLLGVAATGTGALSRVPLAVLTLTALAAFEAVTALPATALQLGQARVAAMRIAAVTDAPDPVRAPCRPRALPPAPFGIQLCDATVRYRPDGPPALDRVSLDLPPGRRVALVGANGAGKSTLAAVLMRFRDLTGGTVLLNGHDLASYAADDVRSVIGGCPQDPYLFDATIRDNLRLARPDATDTELQDAAARARLLPWIRSLPRGWATPVGTGGGAPPRRRPPPPAPARPPGAHRRPAARHPGPLGPAHHPRNRRAGPGRPHRGPRPRPGRRAGQPPPAPPRRRTLPANVGQRTPAAGAALVTWDVPANSPRWGMPPAALMAIMGRVGRPGSAAITAPGDRCGLRCVAGPGEDAMPVYTAAERAADARIGGGPDLDQAGWLAPGLSQSLLAAKFSVPPPHPYAVSRGDLIEAARSSGCPLVAVTAPAGYGKSAFLAEWAAAETRHVAWMSLDRFDDDPAVLLTALAAAYCRAGLASRDLIDDVGGGSRTSVLDRAAPRLAAEFRA